MMREIIIKKGIHAKIVPRHDRQGLLDPSTVISDRQTERIHRHEQLVSTQETSVDKNVLYIDMNFITHSSIILAHAHAHSHYSLKTGSGGQKRERERLPNQDNVKLAGL